MFVKLPMYKSKRGFIYTRAENVSQKRKYNHHQPIPICEMDSSSLCDVAFAMASGSSRGKGNTSLTHTHKMQMDQCRNEKRRSDDGECRT